jgi:hypothetical protein
VGFLIFQSRRSVLIVVFAVTVVAIPIAFGVPAMIGTAPVTVILVPAAFPLGVQITTAAFGLGAALAVMADGFVQPRLSFLNPTLALAVIIVRMNLRNRTEE